MTRGSIPPPDVIASWPPPNYLNPYVRGPGLLVLILLLTAISTLLVALRIFSRLYITRAPGLDDGFCLVALVFAIGQSIVLILAYENHEVGIHIWDVPEPRFITIYTKIWVVELFYIFASSSIKISILLFYRRLSDSFTNGFYIASWVGIAYNIGYCVSFSVSIFAVCQPLDAFWNQFNLPWLAAGHKYKCLDESISLPAAAALGVLGDFYATVLPLVLVRSLTMPRRQKWELYALFALGFFVVAAGIIRTIYSYMVLNTTWDSTYVSYDVWLWVTMEVYLAIVCGSAPALKAFFRKYVPNMRGWLHFGHGLDENGNNVTFGRRGSGRHGLAEEGMGSDSTTSATMVGRSPSEPSGRKLSKVVSILEETAPETEEKSPDHGARGSIGAERGGQDSQKPVEKEGPRREMEGRRGETHVRNFSLPSLPGRDGRSLADQRAMQDVRGSRAPRSAPHSRGSDHFFSTRSPSPWASRETTASHISQLFPPSTTISSIVPGTHSSPSSSSTTPVASPVTAVRAGGDAQDRREDRPSSRSRSSSRASTSTSTSTSSLRLPRQPSPRHSNPTEVDYYRLSLNLQPHRPFRISEIIGVVDA